MKFHLVPNFVTCAESNVLVKLIDAKLLKYKYLDSHFDMVIHGYREVMTADFNTNPVISRIKQATQMIVNRQLQFTLPHILDLRATDSAIKAHIDHLQASGPVIAGLSLLSPAVMIFRKGNDVKKVLLPPNSLYVQWDEFRYEYTHEIPAQTDLEHSIDGAIVPRGRRLAIILRDICA